MNRIRQGKIRIIGTLMVVIGVIAMLSPLIWSIRARYLQSRELAANGTPTPSATVDLQPMLRIMPKSSIIIPKLDVMAAIVEETGKSSFDRGPVHLAGTAIPGQPGNCCIAAHKEKWFHGLKKLAIGDTVYIRTEDASFKYTITRHVIVRANNVSVLDDTPDPTITLITCTGPAYFGHGNGRLVVTGTLTNTKALH